MASWIRRLRFGSRNSLRRYSDEESERESEPDVGTQEEEHQESVAADQESRQIIGHLEVTIFQNVDAELYGNLHRRTFDFIVHEGPEEILKLFMHIHGRSIWGRRGKHVATALVPITHAIESGADSRMVQLIVQPGNQPAATIFVDLKFSKMGDSDDESDSEREVSSDVVVVVPMGESESPVLAVADKSLQLNASSRLDDFLEG